MPVGGEREGVQLPLPPFCPWTYFVKILYWYKSGFVLDVFQAASLVSHFHANLHIYFRKKYKLYSERFRPWFHVYNRRIENQGFLAKPESKTLEWQWSGATSNSTGKSIKHFEKLPTHSSECWIQAEMPFSVRRGQKLLFEWWQLMYREMLL